MAQQIFDSFDNRLTYISPFIFTSIAAVLCGPLTDYATRRLSKVNNGIFEPGVWSSEFCFPDAGIMPIMTVTRIQVAFGRFLCG